MWLARLRVGDFRNLHPQGIVFGPRINILHGENAQGKTNILEAVHLVATLQSFRTRRLRDLVREGCARAAAEGEVEGEYGVTTLRVEATALEKSALLDGKEPASSAGYLSVFPVVFFGPPDMALPRGDQGMRRRYLDRAAFLAEPGHLEKLRNYRRALLQRNAALREGRRDLEPWTGFAARLGWEVHGARARAVANLGPRVARLQAEISGGREAVSLRLAPSGAEMAGWEDLKRRLDETAGEDRERGFTLHGPHRDRVGALLEGRELSAHGSQGQQRTFALALKLALLEWAREAAGVEPAFLLDDPGSELDGRRLGYLGAFLDGWGGQVFIASVGAADVPIGGGTERKTFHVHRGRAEEGGPRG